MICVHVELVLCGQVGAEVSDRRDDGETFLLIDAVIQFSSGEAARKIRNYTSILLRERGADGEVGGVGVEVKA